MKILVAGYPKSGNTWLNYMVAYGAGAKYLDLDNKSKVPKNEIIKRLVGGAGEHSLRSKYTEVHKTHLLPREVDLKAYDKLLYVIRDPKDVSVSFFYFRYFFQAAKKGDNGLQSKVKVPVLGPMIQKWYLLRTLFGTTRAWVNHVLAWGKVSGVMMVRYEDLVTQKEDAMIEIFRFLDLQKELSDLIDIYSKFAFEVMAGNKNEAESKSSFYRKGIVGDHRNHFNKLDLNLYRLLFTKPLKKYKYLGY